MSTYLVRVQIVKVGETGELARFQFSLGNATTLSEPYSSHPNAKRGARDYFESHLPNCEPIFARAKANKETK